MLTSCMTHRYNNDRFVMLSKVDYKNQQLLLYLNPDEVTVNLNNDTVTIWLYDFEGEYIMVKTHCDNVKGVLRKTRIK